MCIVVKKVTQTSKKFLNFRMADTEDMSCFSNEFSNPVDKLAEVGIESSKVLSTFRGCHGD